MAMEMPDYFIGDYFGAGECYFQHQKPTYFINNNNNYNNQFIIDDLLVDFPNNEDIVLNDAFFDNVNRNLTDYSTVTAVDSCSSSVSGGEPPFCGEIRSVRFSESRFSGDEICLPYDDLAELEWLTNFNQESLSTDDFQNLQIISAAVNKTPATYTSSSQTRPEFQQKTVIIPIRTNSPIFETDVFVPAKTRSKRSRIAPFDWTSRILHFKPTSFTSDHIKPHKRTSFNTDDVIKPPKPTSFNNTYDIKPPKPTNTGDIKRRKPTSFNSDDIKPHNKPTSFNADDIKPPNPTSFNADDIKRHKPTSFNGDDIKLHNKPTSFKTDGIKRHKPTSFNTDDIIKPHKPTSFNTDGDIIKPHEPTSFNGVVIKTDNKPTSFDTDYDDKPHKPTSFNTNEIIKPHKPTSFKRRGEILEPSIKIRCLHCGSDKTPQWRSGPMGPKTLCNACGVRYKSGRLVPEYRPASSPTYVSAKHSNSHRKVMEIRRQKELHEVVNRSSVLNESNGGDDCLIDR